MSTLSGDMWGPADTHADDLLKRWAYWAKTGNPSAGKSFPTAQPFAIKTGGPEPISDAWAMEIEHAVISCTPPTRGIIREAYIKNNWNGKPDRIILACLREFLDVYDSKHKQATSGAAE